MSYMHKDENQRNTSIIMASNVLHVYVLIKLKIRIVRTSVFNYRYHCNM